MIPILGLYLGASFSYAQKLHILPEVSKQEVKVGERFKYQIQLQGNFKRSPSLIVPQLANFRIISRNQIYNYQIQAGKVQANLTYQFYLIALEEGEFEIKGFRLKFGLEEYEVEPLKIKVQGVKELPRKEEKPQEFEPEKEGIWI